MEKIVVFTPALNIGGIERILLTYATGLAEKGYEVTYLTLNGSGDFSPKATRNLKFENLGIDRLRKALFVLVRFLRKSNPDIIFVANDATMMIFFAKLLSRVSSKIITSQHNYFDIYKNIGVRQTFVPRYIYPRCFKVIAVSEGIRNMLVNHFRLNNNKVVTICNPIDIEEILIKSSVHIDDELLGEYILFVGRFDRIKNIPLLLKAFKLFNGKYKDLDLVIIGGGLMEEEMKELIKNLGIGNSVKILGVKSNPFPYIKRAKVIALSSLSEAFPTILLESLCLGKTIVSTPTQGGKDILRDGEYGYLSETLENEEDFFNKLVEGYEKPFDNLELMEYTKANFSLEKKVIEFESLMND